MDHVSTGLEAQAQYPNLVDRAIACIEEHGGTLDENSLIARVFGSASSPAMWRSLLRSVLDNHPVVSLRADGVWTTGRPNADGPVTSEFVILDVETTGLKPSQQRIIEVAMIRVSPHGSPLRWSSLVDPGRKLSNYIADHTGLDDATLAAAPEFRSIALTIAEVVEDLPIVGHNVDFDLAFINAELVRCGLQKLVNPAIDTLSLANRFVPEARRLNLDDVARALGIPTKQRHRAMPDADVTLEVFKILLARAQSQGLASLEDLLRTSQSSRSRATSSKPVSRARAILDRSHLSDLPHAPGVYIMRDADDRVLYVGKAKDLRKRVASYYSQPLGYTRKMDGLLETLARIDVEVVGSELEALILESQLIRRYRPRFNTVQRNVEQYVYVKVDISNPWPRIVTSRDRADDGAEYFGPFRSSSRAREAVDLVNDVLPLRTCQRSFADKRSYGSPCLELSMNRCLGPCVGKADSETYRQLVHDVLAFFHGDTPRLIERLHRKLEETVKTLDFERAARLRDRIKQVERLASEQQQIDGATGYTHALLVLPSPSPGNREVWYMLKGRRWAQLTVSSSDDVAALARRVEVIAGRARESEARFVPDHHSVDETAIVARWMRRTPEHPALISLDGDLDLRTICRQVLEVDLSVPFGEAIRESAEQDGIGRDGDDDPE